MKFHLNLVLICQLAQAILCYTNPSITHPKYSLSIDESFPGRYMIEVDSVASSSLLESIKQNRDIHIRQVYTHDLFSGLSIEINNIENEEYILRSILDHPDIVYVSPHRVFKHKAVTLNNVHDLSPENIKNVLPHSIHQVDRVRQELNLTGEGVHVGIIDSGIDYRLKALGGGFGPGYKVSNGWDFVGYDGDSSLDATPRNDSNPLDLCERYTGSTGHGTHVAGIIGGYDPENNFEGVAPGATLSMWRAVGCSGSGTSETLANAALAAYDAGVNILSFSIGSNRPWTDPSTPEYIVFQRMIESGIFVVIAGSNDGASGIFTVTGYLSSSFSVASAVNTYAPDPLSFRATGLKDPMHALASPLVNSTTSTLVNGDLFVAYSNNSSSVFNYCTEEPVSEDIKGKIALVSGGCSSASAVTQVEALGGIGAIIISSYDFASGEQYLHLNSSIPTVVVKKSDGELLRTTHIANNNKTSIEFFKPASPITLDSRVKTISDFSSVGPTADLSLSPNIAAVGENVFSTVPEQLGSYGFMSGTSMAAPYISGTLALYLQYHGINKTKFDVVLAKYKNYASLTSLDRFGSGTIENPIRQGAGLVQVYDTITQSNYVTPTEISFKDSSFQAEKTQQLTITNDGTDVVTYRLYNNVSTAVVPFDPASPGHYVFAAPSGNEVASADITFSVNEVTLNPAESQTVTVTVTPPSTNPTDYIIYGGYIQFSPVKNGDSIHKDIHIPYFGVVGTLNELPIFQPETVNFTYNDGNEFFSYYDKAPAKSPNLTYTLDTQKTPEAFISISFVALTPTQAILLNVMDSTTNEEVGSIVAAQLTGTVKTTHSVDFDGTYCISNNGTLDCTQLLTNGTYYLQLAALKLFGDGDNPNGAQHWTSVPFSVVAK